MGTSVSKDPSSGAALNHINLPLEASNLSLSASGIRVLCGNCVFGLRAHVIGLVCSCLMEMEKIQGCHRGSSDFETYVFIRPGLTCRMMILEVKGRWYTMQGGA